MVYEQYFTHIEHDVKHDVKRAIFKIRVTRIDMPLAFRFGLQYR
jgi:hypothetical protein